MRVRPRRRDAPLRAGRNIQLHTGANKWLAAGEREKLNAVPPVDSLVLRHSLTQVGIVRTERSHALPLSHKRRIANTIRQSYPPLSIAETYAT